MKMKRLLSLLLAMALIMALPVTGLAASKPSIALGVKVGLMFVGEKVQLKPKIKNLSRLDVTFASSESDVATISNYGVIEALTEGRTVISVYGGGAMAQCGVVVLPRSVSVAVGESVSLPNGTVEAYRIKDIDIAEVGPNGVITGKKAGDTVLAVKSGKQVLAIEVKVTKESSAENELTPEPTPAVPEVGSKAAQLAAAATASQIVLVEYTGGSNARLSVHEKINDVWVERLETSAYVGKNGIGKTVEGDKKTPTGTYNLTTPFGIKDDPGARMAYTKVTKYHYWCGASKSGYYNQLVDSRETGREYTSSDEHLIDYKGVYNYCMFIDYNAEGTPGKGSCIFLHCKGGNPYTAGCVAIDEESMKQIIQWAKPGVKIVIQKADQ